MENIKVNWGANISEGTATINIENMNVDSMEEWDALSKEEKTDKIQHVLNEFTEQPFMVVESFENEE